jgi:glutamate synthase domain-containing protein 1
MSRVDVWMVMREDVKDLWMKIVREDVRESEQYLVHSWRYHVTYLKVLGSIIDSQEEYNEDYLTTIILTKEELKSVSYFNKFMS